MELKRPLRQDWTDGTRPEKENRECCPIVNSTGEPLIHVQASSPHATILQWLLQQLVSEQTLDLPGMTLASSQLAQLLFVQILRVHLETASASAVGLLRTVSDKRLAPALRLMHGEPGRSWHLEDLADPLLCRGLPLPRISRRWRA